MTIRRRHLGLAALASLLAAGVALWRWVDRPALSLRCPGGARPEDVSIGTVIGAGHGVMFSNVTLTGSKMTGAYLSRPGAREVDQAEKEVLLKRLERPRPAPTHLGSAETQIQFSYTCGGKRREKEFEAKVGQQHFSFKSWLEAPTRLERLRGAVIGGLRDLDPYPRKIVATAFEVMHLAESMPGK